MDLKTRADLVARHVAAESAHDMAGTLATLHPECIFEDLAVGRVWRGHAGAREHYNEWWNGLDTTVENGRRAWAEDGSLIAEAGFACRHIGPFLGIQATQRIFKLRFVVIVSFRNGLMLGERFYYSLDALLEHLGQSRREPYIGEAA